MDHIMDNTAWDFIGDKMKDIHSGLLRFRDKTGKKAFEVLSVQPDHPSSVSFEIAQSDNPEKLINYSASLVQKTADGYLYITGLISGINQDHMLLMSISKAYWFVRKGKGDSSWFEEAYAYEQLENAN
jgi:hypothetical protein